MTSPVAQMPQPAVTQPGLSQPAQPSQSSSDLPRDTAASVGVPQTEVDAVWTKFCSDAETQVAIPEGRFTSVAEKASIVLDEFVGTDKEAITLEQILHMPQRTSYASVRCTHKRGGAMACG